MRHILTSCQWLMLMLSLHYKRTQIHKLKVLWLTKWLHVFLLCLILLKPEGTCQFRKGRSASMRRFSPAAAHLPALPFFRDFKSKNKKLNIYVFIYLFITLQHTQIRCHEVSLSDYDIIEDDHVLCDESNNWDEWDEEHEWHVDQLSTLKILY